MPDPADSVSPVATLDPRLLEDFLQELAESGWTPVNTARSEWCGDIPRSLSEFTDATEMRLILRDAWPYRPPALKVPGIDSWHAGHDHLCLWQEGDDTRQWVTLAGIHKRIEAWARDARAGFIDLGAALDAHLHFAPIAVDFAVYLDIDQLVSGAYQNGQHGFLHGRFINTTLLQIEPGKLRSLPNKPRGIPGRWFFREHMAAPPRSTREFEEALTGGQRRKLDRDRSDHELAIFILIWKSTHGLVPLVVLHNRESEGSDLAAIAPTPKNLEDRQRRAGPDAAALGEASVVVFGVGSIGSHIAAGLARSGVGRLTLVDGDRIWPAGLVRHAAAPGTVGDLKPTAMKRTLAFCEWTEITGDARSLWRPDDLKDRISGHDLVVEAVGQATFTELLSRVCRGQRVPFVSAALYRGGRLTRVRRQAGDDTPVAARSGHSAYRPIPPDPDQVDAYVGVEVGCSAPISNAPPVAVLRSSGLATQVAIDWLTERRDLPDELVEVIEPIEPPFDRRGLIAPRLVPEEILIVEDEAAAMRSLAASALPNETGGILLGYMSSGEPLVTRCIHLPPASPRPDSFAIESGATSEAVNAARTDDPSIGYLGEWHSHPTDQPASATDRETMVKLTGTGAGGCPILLVVCPLAGGPNRLLAYASTIDGLVELPVQVVGRPLT